ncbi:MAG: chemotaxis protein CheW [Bacteroidetes bacterium]|nr:chemotaxis protein CheW [Bacteroidota bacterium]
MKKKSTTVSEPSFQLKSETYSTASSIALEFERSAPAPETGKERTSKIYVSFRAGNEEYALPIFSVKEILKNEYITFIPHAPANVLGIIQLRGRVIPVIDLKKRLGLSQNEYPENAKLIICIVDNQQIGIKVDSVNRVLKIFDDQLELPPEKLLNEHKNTIRQIAHFESGLILLLDETKLNKVDFQAEPVP